MQPLKAETEKSTEPPRSDVRTPQAAAGSKGFVVGLVGAALAQHLERAADGAGGSLPRWPAKPPVFSRRRPIFTRRPRRIRWRRPRPARYTALLYSYGVVYVNSRRLTSVQRRGRGDTGCFGWAAEVRCADTVTRTKKHVFCRQAVLYPDGDATPVRIGF